MKRESIQRQAALGGCQRVLQRPFNLASEAHLPTSSSLLHALHPSQIKLREQPVCPVPVLVQVAPGSDRLQATPAPVPVSLCPPFRG